MNRADAKTSPDLSDPDRQRLLCRIRRKFETATQDVSVGPLSLRFTRIADPNRVLDLVAEEEDRRDKLAGRRRDEAVLHLPYWAELWDSAMAVSEDLAAIGVSGLSILDLGCGMGLTGTVAAALGARVLFADLEPDALLFATLNSLPWRDHVRTWQLDWRTARLDERFDLIIGADILYEKGQWPHLEPFWRNHLKPGGTVLLGEPGRQTGDLFLDWIKPFPWHLERSQRSVATRPRPIRLFKLAPVLSTEKVARIHK
jgi:predicted nicotinamide N-methyase